MSLLRTVLQPGGRRPWSAVAAVGIQPPLPRRAALLPLPPTPQCKRAARYAVGTGALCTPRRWSSSEAPKQRCGLYAGTFDPPSTGHLDIIRRALQLGDQLIVAVGTNLAKKPIFSVQERVELLQNMVAAEISNRVQDVTIGVCQRPACVPPQHAQRAGLRCVYCCARGLSSCSCL
ncbi:MAG: hypothetical protein EOO41_05035 [Methanobacteriota archaeon]|nr:MAG: hypothetical protein EOO41_05035 [Euryarchaeota archaeon]